MKNTLYKTYICIITIVFTINLLSIFNISFFGFRIFRVGSGSMEPYLKVNDIVVIKKENDYKVNDIVTYDNGNEYITHRIIKIDDNKIVTKGDSNNKEDNPIKRENIIGKLAFKITGLGFIIYLFSKPTSWILLFIIGLIITILIPDKKENKNIYERRTKHEKKNKIKKEICRIFIFVCSVFYFVFYIDNTF